MSDVSDNDGARDNAAQEATELLDSWLRAADPAVHMHEDAFRGRLKAGRLRAVAWKVFLSVLPALPSMKDVKADDDAEEEFIDSLATNLSRRFSSLRTRYADLRKRIAQPGDAEQETTKPAAPKPKKAPQRAAPRFGDDSDSSDSDGGGDAVASVAGPGAQPAVAGADDPLSGKQDGIWAKFFEHQKSLEIVDKDLSRLWGGDPFFEMDSTREDLRAVLETLIVSGVEYRQGMHEIASILYLANVRDAETANKVPASHKLSELLRTTCSRRFVKEDTFVMLLAVLGTPAQVAAFDLHRTLQLAAWYDAELAPAGCDVVSVASQVQTSMLAQLNAACAKHIASMDVQPVLYGLRWLRLLFVREFSLSQAAVVWDSVFAELHIEGLPVWQSVVPYIGVAMLGYISESLLEMEDSAVVLRRLMRYPPVENVSRILSVALTERHGADSRIAGLADIAPVSRTSFAAPATDDGPISPVTPQGPPARAAHVSNAAPPGTPPPADALVALQSRDHRLGEDLQTAIAELVAATNDDDKALAIAKLKRVRDVLLFDL